MKTLNVVAQLLTLSSVLMIAITADAQTTAFNYQGRLTDGGNPASGSFQMQFKLFDAVAGGSQIGSTLSDVAVTAASGTFSTKLDFGVAALTGANRWIEIAVRRNSAESYVTLAPREQIASSPYAVRTLSAASADNALNLGGVPASEYVTNSNVGSQFIRNGTALQTGNFSISGNGFVGGSIGLGASPDANYRLNTFGGIRAFSASAAHFVAETNGGTNSWARFYARSPNRSWFIGTSQNFNGDQFYLVDETANQIRMAISTGGLFGINNTNPQSGLDIRGTGLQSQQRITDNTSGNSLVLQGGAGSNMKVTGYNYGTNAAVPLYLSVDGANTYFGGNAAQPRGNTGLVKAMIYVDSDGSIIRCYNSVSGSSTGNCGFSVTESLVGIYTINFGFQISDRFYYLTGASDDRFPIWNSDCQGCGSNQLLVQVVNSAGTRGNGRFMAIVF